LILAFVIVKDGIATLPPAYLELAVLTVVVVPKYAGGSVAIPSLTITNANIKDDEGRYICSATNSISTGNSEPAFLDVIGGKYIATITDPINKYDEIYTKCGCLTTLSVMFGMG
jgi:hypothetical protein